MGRAPCCDKANVKKGPWSPEEDAKLKDFIEKYGTGGNWIALPQKAGLRRCGKSCRLRWLNYLRPNIRHGEFSEEEDRIICSLYANIGSRWSIIAAQLPGRTDNDIKNYWNTKLKKKLLSMLPFLQQNPSSFPTIPFLQSPPPPPNDQDKSAQFMNPSSSSPSSSCFNYNPNFNTNSTTTNAALFHDPINLASDFSPPSPVNHLISLMTHNTIAVNDQFYQLGIQYEHHSMYSSQEMFMFGGGGGHEVTTTCSSSEGGSSMSQISHGEHSEDHPQIKQELDQIALQGFGSQSQRFMIDHTYMDQNPIGYLKNYESPLHNEVKQVIDNNNNIHSYLFNDGDENKTAHYDQKGVCYYY